MSKTAGIVLFAVALMQCGTGMQQDEDIIEQQPGVVWATNVGGGAYVSSDGIHYRAETGVSGGQVLTLSGIKGSQDPELYQTYREGRIVVEAEVPNGRYNVVLHFAEPAEIGGGERLFDVIINGIRRIAALDVMGWRDGKVFSALTIASNDVVADDGRIRITFDAIEREPVLSAVVIRENRSRDPDWKLVWRDEFEVDGAPDPERWSYNVWPAKKVNDEDQTYTDRPENVRVESGHLVIEARRESLNGAEYTSGRIHTAGKGDFLYGRFEIRAKVPRGQGTWPAIWMLPSDPFRYATTCEAGEDWQGSATCDAWPNSGEIDILEHVGYQMGHVHGTVHNRAYYWVNWEQRKGRIIEPTVDDAFHVYALEWSEDRIDIFVDDALYFSYVNEGTGWQAWPYDHEFHLIINIAMGGVWGRAGGPVDDTVLPQKLLVDYVRVYQKD